MNGTSVQSAKSNLSHIGLLEYEEHLGPYVMPKVALYNKTKFSADAAFTKVRSGEYDDNIVILEKQQWLSLFKNE